MQFKDRIKELRRVRASELLPNPRNWRRHPEGQSNVLRGALEEIGYADALIAYETPDGLMLIDGHLRAETTPDMEVPVLVTDLDEQEANALLATLDPLAAMADPDQDKLTALLETVTSSNDSMNALLETLKDGYDPLILSDDQPEPDNPYTRKIETPIYEPTGIPPNLNDLRDRNIADALIEEIKQANLPDEIKEFLFDAAERHVVFHFQRIANYYAHASPDIKALMGRSALVIIDYNQAVENGFIKFQEDIDGAFREDYPNA